MESILTSIKKLLGIAEDYTEFDTDIILSINSALAILTQIGVGPDEGFMITDATKTWNDFLGDDNRLNFVKTYVHLKVKLMFDPPTSSSVMQAQNDILKELEYRMYVVTDNDREV